MSAAELALQLTSKAFTLKESSLKVCSGAEVETIFNSQACCTAKEIARRWILLFVTALNRFRCYLLISAMFLFLASSFSPWWFSPFAAIHAFSTVTFRPRYLSVLISSREKWNFWRTACVINYHSLLEDVSLKILSDSGELLMLILHCSG